MDSGEYEFLKGQTFQDFFNKFNKTSLDFFIDNFDFESFLKLKVVKFFTIKIMNIKNKVKVLENLRETNEVKIDNNLEHPRVSKKYEIFKNTILLDKKIYRSLVFSFLK